MWIQKNLAGDKCPESLKYFYNNPFNLSVRSNFKKI